MLDFTSPNLRSPIRQIAEADLKEARVLAMRARRTSDIEKISRFHSVLRNHGAMAKDPEALPDTTDRPETVEETSCLERLPHRDSGMMFCSANPGISLPRIIALERLSNGNFLLAWEGDPEKLYYVEWSDDLESWKPDGDLMPTVGGIGTWGQVTGAPSRFFRVVEQAIGPTTTPSDPAGGDGVSTFGGMLSFNATGTLATVTVNLPGGIEPALVHLFIDGVWYGYCNGANGVYTCSVSAERIPTGIRSAFALIDANRDTTPSPENPPPVSPGTLRTAEVSFSPDPGGWGFTGFRATETEINDGTPGSPESTVLMVEYPYTLTGEDPVDEFEYEMAIIDENGILVREWTGTEQGPGPGTLSFFWDGTDNSGATLPFGTYEGLFRFTFPADVGVVEPIYVWHGVATLKAMAVYETLAELSPKTPEKLETYRPSWNGTLTSSGGLENPAADSRHWGPWKPLGGGPGAVCGAMQKGLGGPETEWKFTFWGTGNIYSDAEPWASNGTRPAPDFYTGNPFNDYDIGFLMGHGVASSGGAYIDGAGNALTMPPQHFLPLVLNPDTGASVWLKSGEMAKKFGDEGRLKWMFVLTCNYLRVGAHNSGSHDIYPAMKAANTLPIGPNLHVLCSYSTSIDIDGKLGVALSAGLLQEIAGAEEMTVVQAWNHAWDRSDNKSNGRNARSVYWPECVDDTILGVPNENVTTPVAHASQADLRETDSRTFP